MEREANYAAVGLFVLLVITMGGLFVYWYSDGRDHTDYKRYEIYFDGSVTGLSEGGPVRFLGVDVGRVWRVRLDRRAAGRVQVVADIDSTAPVSDTTLAQLSTQGVTGVLYIDLLQASQADPARRILEVPSESYPVIRSVRSDLDVLVSSLPDMVARVSDMVTRTARLLSEDNIKAVQNVVNNLDRASAQLPQAAQNFNALMADLRSATGEARGVVKSMASTTDAAAPELAAAIRQLRVTSDHIAQATDHLDKFIAANSGGMQSFVQQGLPQMESLLRDSRDTVVELRKLARSLRDDPSQLIYQPARSGVEIAR
ncbi:MAG: MlaD family protein [Steroidobacteraceae bacterium]